MINKKILLDSNWTFRKTDGTVKTVCIPHDAMIHEPRGNCLNGPKTGFFPGGKYVYEKEIDIPNEFIGKYISVLFEGVYRNATVYLNGEKIGDHSYGYTEFEIELSGVVKEGINRLKVEVDNSLEPNSRWYSGSGIYRPVYLIVKELEHIKNLRIKTTSINPARINISLDNDDATVYIYDGDRLVLSSPKGDIVIDNAKLWDDINPHLYKIKVSTKNDEVVLNYGIRELKWSPKTGVSVNGREVKFRGSCIHHDNGILGACDYADAADRKIRILKENGYNAIRSAHNPCSRYILDACDKYGVYAMDESFDMWYVPKTYHDYSRNFIGNYKNDIKSMIEKDFNHPSVVMYSIGNENPEPGTEEGREMMREQSEYVKSLDATRIVTIGANLMIMKFPIYKENGPYEAGKELTLEDEIKKLDKKGSTGFNFLASMMPSLMVASSKMKRYGILADKLVNYVDVLGLNYGTPRYEIDIKRDPNRMLVGSETFNSQIVRNWNLVMKYHQLIGDFCWTGYDYLGEADGGCGTFDYKKWPGLPIADGAGAIDLIGNPTPISYYMQIAYGTYKKPCIAVSPVSYNGEKYVKGAWRMNNYLHSWSWDGFEGQDAIVEVYTSAYKVKLTLNDRVIGFKKTKDNIARFKLKYASGILKAFAYDDKDNQCGTDVLVSAQKDTIITLKADKVKLTANNQDLCHLNIDLTDEKGVIKPTREDVIKVETLGNSVKLVGLGTGRGKIEGSYDGDKTIAHFGRALAIFKATNTKGVTTIKVNVDGLESKEIVISTE